MRNRISWIVFSLIGVTYTSYAQQRTNNAEETIDYLSIGIAYDRNHEFQKADSAFSKLIESQPEFLLGYYWKGRVKQEENLDVMKGLAVPYYEKCIELASKDSKKYLNELLGCYRYLGYYYYLVKDFSKARIAYESILLLKPLDKDAKDALDILKKF